MSSHIQPILSRVRQSELDKIFYNSENILCTIVSQDRQLSKIFYTIDKRVSITLDTVFLIANCHQLTSICSKRKLGVKQFLIHVH